MTSEPSWRVNVFVIVAVAVVLLAMVTDVGLTAEPVHT